MLMQEKKLAYRHGSTLQNNVAYNSLKSREPAASTGAPPHRQWFDCFWLRTRIPMRPSRELSAIGLISVPWFLDKWFGRSTRYTLLAAQVKQLTMRTCTTSCSPVRSNSKRLRARQSFLKYSGRIWESDWLLALSGRLARCKLDSDWSMRLAMWQHARKLTDAALGSTEDLWAEKKFRYKQQILYFFVWHLWVHARLQYLAGRQPIQSRIMALAQSTSVHLSEDLPEQIEQICVIFRPDFGRGQQLTARTTSPFTQDIIMGAALNTWPDLQIPHFHVQEVHISVLDDFNFEPSVKFMMAVSYIDFQTAPALRGVLIHLRIEKARDVKAVPLNHESSALSLLSWARLVHRCLRGRSHHCGIWRNGWEVSGQRAIYLEHGDYVRIEAFKKEEQEHNCDFIEVSDLHYAPEFTVEGFWPMSRDRSGQSQGWTSTSEADGARHLPRPRLRMLDICFPTSRLIKNEAGKFSG